MEDATSHALLYHRIREALLQEWDPIGIEQFPEAQDEYDSYVPEVCDLLLRKATVDELLKHLWDLETGHMGLQGDRERTHDFALKLQAIGNEVLGKA